MMAQPLTNPMLIYWQVGSKENISAQFQAPKCLDIPPGLCINLQVFAQLIKC